MRKISQTRPVQGEQQGFDTERSDPRPRRVPGATITSWNGSPDIDLDALFAQPGKGPTVLGGTVAGNNRPARGTVSLSDGTKITFTRSDQFIDVSSI
jgi:hypothetical protein